MGLAAGFAIGFAAGLAAGFAIGFFAIGLAAGFLTAGLVLFASAIFNFSLSRCIIAINYKQILLQLKKIGVIF
jgi:hypothetical protein